MLRKRCRVAARLQELQHERFLVWRNTTEVTKRQMKNWIRSLLDFNNSNILIALFFQITCEARALIFLHFELLLNRLKLSLERLDLSTVFATLKQIELEHSSDKFVEQLTVAVPK